MSIDVKSLSSKQRVKLMQELREAEEQEKHAYKKEFIDDVASIAMDKGIRWSEARSLIGNFNPKNDTEAKKLGFTYKKGNKYYHRKVEGAAKLK